MVVFGVLHLCTAPCTFPGDPWGLPPGTLVLKVSSKQQVGWVQAGGGGRRLDNGKGVEAHPLWQVNHPRAPCRSFGCRGHRPRCTSSAPVRPSLPHLSRLTSRGLTVPPPCRVCSQSPQEKSHLVLSPLTLARSFPCVPGLQTVPGASVGHDHHAVSHRRHPVCLSGQCHHLSSLHSRHHKVCRVAHVGARPGSWQHL